MDPQSYMQLMQQQLMGGSTMAPGMGGQNATSPYGMAFQTGNMMMPQQTQQAPQTLQGMLGQGPSSVLQQPMAAYQ
jgi:hypothetical protein